MRTNRVSSPSSRSSGSMFAASDSAEAGSGCVSRKIPSVPTATAARPMVSISSGSPPATPDARLGCWSECVMSVTTGCPKACMRGMPRKSTTRSVYPKVVPRSVSITFGLPASTTFCAAKRIASGARNCPFLMFTIRPVCAAAISRSVCRQRKAGICNTSTNSAAKAASCVS